MCDDPTSLTPDAREAIEKYADKESRDMGFDNWIDAYHWTPDSQANVEVCDGGRKASELKQDANRHSQH